MNDEIKYWLEGLDELSYEKVLDYITNLQQTLDETVDNYTEEYNLRKELDLKLNILQEENEYLKKHQRFHKKFGDDYIFCVEGDKETYKDLLLEKQEELEDYKSRCEKAIEYIKENLTLVSILDGKKFYGLNDYKFSYQDLLNILQNGSENK